MTFVCPICKAKVGVLDKRYPPTCNGDNKHKTTVMVEKGAKK